MDGSKSRYAVRNKNEGILMSRVSFIILYFLPICLTQVSFAQSLSLDQEHNNEFVQNQQQRLFAQASPPPNLSAEELRQLVLFDDIVVIQRRFLPKVSRFEFHPSIRWIINDPFHYHFMFSGQLGYHFSEYLGIEVFGGYVLGPNRKVTNDLKNNRDINVTNVVFPRLLYGLGLKWSPLYGKFGGIGGSILPFDMYFSVGGGMSRLNTTIKRPESTAGDPIYSCDANAITLKLETGQLIPFSKGGALRWSIGWLLHPKMFDWTCEDQPIANLGVEGPSGFNMDIYFSIGWSLFFPGAKYR